jgi:ATPase family associated with various cellular activities (AAA)
VGQSNEEVGRNRRAAEGVSARPPELDELLDFVAAEIEAEAKPATQQTDDFDPLARLTAIGTVVARYDGGEERVVEGTRYGAGPSWYTGPYGDPEPLVRALWEHHRSLALVGSETTLQLIADERPTAEPSAAVREMTAQCEALSSAGARVGLLIHGRPGTGKSQALLHVALALGGRTVRASFKRVTPGDVLGVAVTLGATAVVLDDIDRAPTTEALDAVEQLVDHGIAVLATANNKGRICEALLRDGRIDDHRVFGAVEPDVLERLAAGLEPEVVARLATCTVATVARYVERRRALGPARAAELLPAPLETTKREVEP